MGVPARHRAGHVIVRVSTSLISATDWLSAGHQSSEPRGRRASLEAAERTRRKNGTSGGVTKRCAEAARD